jgi:hypothetical protein
MHGRIQDCVIGSRPSAVRRLRRARSGAALAAAAALSAATAIFLGGCETPAKPAPEIDPDFQLPPGEHGLRKVPEGQHPDLADAFAAKDAAFGKALS